MKGAVAEGATAVGAAVAGDLSDYRGPHISIHYKNMVADSNF